MFRIKLLILPLLLLLTAAPAARAQVEKSVYKLGLILPEKDRRHDGEVFAAASAAFVDSKRFKVVERKELNAVFTEKDLQEFIGGQVNNKLSDVLGLDFMGIVGYTVDTKHVPGGKTEKTWIFDVRLVDVKTAAVLMNLTSERFSFLPPETPRDAGKLLFASIREAFPPMGYVIRVDGKKVIVNLGSETGIKEGDTLEIVRQGEEIIDPTNGQVYPAPLEVIGELKVVSINPQLSTCKLKSMKNKGELALASLVRLEERDSRFLGWMQKIPRLKEEWKKKKAEVKE